MLPVSSAAAHFFILSLLLDYRLPAAFGKEIPLTKKQSPEDTAPICQEHHNHHISLEHMISEDNIDALADLLKVFGDPTRIRILHALSCQELCVCDIAEALGMTQSAISHQLRVLKQSRLVNYRREGKTIYYSLADSHVHEIGRAHV